MVQHPVVAAVFQLRIVAKVFGALYDPAGDPESLHELHQLEACVAPLRRMLGVLALHPLRVPGVARVVLDPVAEMPVDLLLLFESLAAAPHALEIRPLRAAHGRLERIPVILGLAADHHPLAVARPVTAVGRRVQIAVADPDLLVPVDREVEDGGTEPVDRRLELSEVNVLPGARSAAIIEGRDQGCGGKVGRKEVSVGNARSDRRSIGEAGQMTEPRCRLKDMPVAGEPGPGAGLAEQRHCDHHEVRPHLPEVLVPDAEPLHRPRRE